MVHAAFFLSNSFSILAIFIFLPLTYIGDHAAATASHLYYLVYLLLMGTHPIAPGKKRARG